MRFCAGCCTQTGRVYALPTFFMRGFVAMPIGMDDIVMAILLIDR
jgi:hypothetical protein